MADKNDSTYQKKVSDYYDTDARLGFESRANANPLLDKIRSDFRQITTKFGFSNALEIGCGPGFDLQWFANRFPAENITGVDISEEMVKLARARIRETGLENALVLQSDEKQLTEHFHPAGFDLVYVYFGALNTVEDLARSAQSIHELLKPGGHAVLTFVNKWYIREMLVQLLKGRIKSAFARLRKFWGGYSPERYLPSKCYSPGQVRDAFRNFKLLERKGYSIFFPAWYNYPRFKRKEKKLEKLWSFDQKLQGTFLWSMGEYTLFVFRKE